MSKPVVAVDIDDVLTEGDYISELMQKTFNKSISINGWYSLADLAEFYELDVSSTQSIIHRYLMSDEFKAIKPVNGSVDALKRLEKLYRIVIITSRPRIIEETTKEWLYTYFPSVFTDIHFANTAYDWGAATHQSLTKGELCKSLGAVYLVDDALHHVQSAAAVGVKGYYLEITNGISLVSCPMGW